MAQRVHDLANAGGKVAASGRLFSIMRALDGITAIDAQTSPRVRQGCPGNDSL
jgi:hypothetical protein